MSDYNRPHPAGPSITSVNNERIRYVKSLYRTAERKREKLFIVEGVRLLEDALAAGARPELVLVDENQLRRTPRGTALLERLQDFELWTVSEEVLDTLSDTVTPQGVIALFPIPATPKEPELGMVTLVLDRVRDPGNAGTILRSAGASGVVRTVAFVDSVDAYSPKVVRAGMGAHFRLTILEDARFADVQSILHDRPIYVAEATGSTPYDQVDWGQNCALVLGGEAEGASEGAQASATQTIRIPMVDSAESLNAAMAATVLLFDVARVRRAAGELAEGTPKPRPKFEPTFERRPRREPFSAPGTERDESAPRPFAPRPYPTGPRPFRPRDERRDDESDRYPRRGEERPPWRAGREDSFERRDEPRPYPRRDERGPYRPRDDDRPFRQREDDRPYRSRDEERSYPPRGEDRPFPPRDDRRPYAPRGDERPYPPRGEGRPYPPRGEGKPYPPRGEGRPYPPRGEGKPFAPRGEGKPYPPRGEGKPYPPRGEGKPYPPRGEGRPFGRTGDDRDFPPRGEGKPFAPRGEGKPFGGGGFRDSGPPRWGDKGGETGPRRPRDGGTSDRPGGFTPKPPRRPGGGGPPGRRPRP